MLSSNPRFGQIQEAFDESPATFASSHQSRTYVWAVRWLAKGILLFIKYWTVVNGRFDEN
jgi:hypothetical protein